MTNMKQSHQTSNSASNRENHHAQKNQPGGSDFDTTPSIQRLQQFPALMRVSEMNSLQHLVGNRAAAEMIQRAPWDNRMPPGTPEVTTLDEAKARLLAEGPTTGKGKSGRKQVAEAWFKHILTKYTLTGGKVKDTYKSSHDSGSGEFSVSQPIAQIPEIVIHAHMDASGKAKTDDGTSKAGPVHWKWAESEFGESFKLSPSEYASILDEKGAKQHWDAQSTPTPPTSTGTTGTVGSLGTL